MVSEKRSQWAAFKAWLYSDACMEPECPGRVRIIDGSRFGLASRREYIYCDACLERIGVGRWRDAT